jgi:acetylglutamate kinase
LKALVKIGGTLVDDTGSRNAIARQIAALAAQGAATAVVHGGGKQMTRFLEERGIQSSFVRGLRVTTGEVIDAVLKVFAGSVNAQVVSALQLAGADAVGLTGIDTGLATAEQLDPELGLVGKVVLSDTRVLDVLTGASFIPVIACVAGGANGEVFNVNADSMAVAIASNWKAERLVFLTDVAGVLDAHKAVISEMAIPDCRALITAGVATGGMQAKLNAAMDAVAAGVQEVRIVNGSEPDVVARVMAGEKCGTRIIASRVVEFAG